MCDLMSKDRPGHAGSPPGHTWPPGSAVGRPQPAGQPVRHGQGRSKSKKGNRYLAAVAGETAVAAGKTQTHEGARYRRPTRRRSKAKARVALGNTQLKVYHKLLSHPGTRYEDLGPDYYERQRDTRRQVAHHVGKLGALGFEVTLCRIPVPEDAADTPAA